MEENNFIKDQEPAPAPDNSAVVPPESNPPPETPKPDGHIKRVVVVGGAGILVMLGALFYAYWLGYSAFTKINEEAEKARQEMQALEEKRKSGDMIACTQEAKLCPDGSAVGRTGPKCEFAPCPGEEIPVDWKKYENFEYGFELRYPEGLEFYNYGSVGTRLLGVSFTEINSEIPSIHVEILNEEYSEKLSDSRQRLTDSNKYIGITDMQYSLGGVIIGRIIGNEGERGSESNMYREIIMPLENKGVLFITSVGFEETLLNQILSTFKFIELEGEFCAQVITPARNPQTGEVKQFPTPCDVPDGWIVI
jgi:hypothetical protein